MKKALIVLLSIMMMLVGCSSKSSNETNETNNTNETNEKITYPYTTSDGLTIDSLFEYSGFNPDDGELEEENIASLQLTNNTGSYLDEANISMTLNDGTKLSYKAYDIPVDGIIYAYDLNNTIIDNEDTKEINCDVTKSEQTNLLGDISASNEYPIVTLTNNTSNSYSNLVVKCHACLNGTYFGGISYSYNVSLEANSSTTIDVSNVTLGMVEVVGIFEE